MRPPQQRAHAEQQQQSSAKGKANGKGVAPSSKSMPVAPPRKVGGKPQTTRGKKAVGRNDKAGKFTRLGEDPRAAGGNVRAFERFAGRARGAVGGLDDDDDDDDDDEEEEEETMAAARSSTRVVGSAAPPAAPRAVPAVAATSALAQLAGKHEAEQRHLATRVDASFGEGLDPGEVC